MSLFLTVLWWLFQPENGFCDKISARSGISGAWNCSWEKPFWSNLVYSEVKSCSWKVGRLFTTQPVTLGNFIGLGLQTPPKEV